MDSRLKGTHNARHNIAASALSNIVNAVTKGEHFKGACLPGQHDLNLTHTTYTTMNDAGAESPTLKGKHAGETDDGLDASHRVTGGY